MAVKQADKIWTDPKQVIVARRDLLMGPGKLAAQVAHASIKVLLDMGDWGESYTGDYVFTLSPPSEEFIYWMRESFPKIVLGVNSEEEIETLYSEAQRAGLPCSKIEDTGRTVYDGARNLTCIAIGPADRQSIDAITGHLQLYKPWDIESEGLPECITALDNETRKKVLIQFGYKG